MPHGKLRNSGNASRLSEQLKEGMDIYKRMKLGVSGCVEEYNSWAERAGQKLRFRGWQPRLLPATALLAELLHDWVRLR